MKWEPLTRNINALNCTQKSNNQNNTPPPTKLQGLQVLLFFSHPHLVLQHTTISNEFWRCCCRWVSVFFNTILIWQARQHWHGLHTSFLLSHQAWWMPLILLVERNYWISSMSYSTSIWPRLSRPLQVRHVELSLIGLAEKSHVFNCWS